MKFPHWPEPIGYRDITLGLERVEELLRRLGNPERKLPPVIHVAGTNGKGSTIAFLRAIFEAAGMKCHVYTSPHLVEFNERIVLAGMPISDRMLAEVMEECRVAAGEVPVSFFEGTTAGAFLAFARVKADIVLLETGMGGRLDATNVLVKPALTIITPIGLDHQSYLGDTLAKIAYEKAGIMKKGVTCVSAPQEPEAREVLEDYAQKIGAKLVFADKEIKLPELSLKGPHQQVNARVAVTACSVLGDRSSVFSDHRTPITEHISQGLQSAKWPARLQRLEKGKLVKVLSPDTELWLDGGHNAHAGEALGEQARLWQDRPLYIICGMMGDKDAVEFLRPMAPYVKACYGVPVEGEHFQKQARPAYDTAQAARESGVKGEEAESVGDALKKIPAGSRVLICGSLYLAGTVLAENKE